MKIEIFYARKLYQGKVDIWSTIVEYCKRLNRKLIVDYEGQRMLIHNLDAYEYEGQNYTAQYADKYMKRGQTYKLYRFTWLPIEQKKGEQEISLGGRMMMLRAWKEMQEKKHLTQGR